MSYHKKCDITCCASRRGSSAAFTLIELLVVVALILLLAAILLPAVGRVSDQIKAYRCLSNLRQIASATFAYASDHDGILPYGVQQNTFGWRWETSLLSYLGIMKASEFTFSDEAFNRLYFIEGPKFKQGLPFVPVISVFMCPADDLVFRCSVNGMPKSYSGNNGLYYDGSMPYGLRVSLSSIPMPNLTLLYNEHWGGEVGMNWGLYMPLFTRSEAYLNWDLRDASAREDLLQNFGIDAGPIMALLERPAFGSAWLDSYDFCVPAGYPHHLGKMNVSLCDGSAHTKRIEDLFFPTNYWSLGLARKLPP